MKKNTPLLTGSLFLLAVVALLEWITLRKTNGTFCYPLDDTFIHMAVAKNVALFSNWGITPMNGYPLLRPLSLQPCLP